MTVLAEDLTLYPVDRQMVLERSVRFLGTNFCGAPEFPRAVLDDLEAALGLPAAIADGARKWIRSGDFRRCKFGGRRRGTILTPHRLAVALVAATDEMRGGGEAKADFERAAAAAFVVFWGAAAPPYVAQLEQYFFAEAWRP